MLNTLSSLNNEIIIITIYEAKTKALISCAVAAQLICVFVLAYAKRRFSYDAVQLIMKLLFSGI